MSSFNKVIIMGRLTRDPELRVTPAGTSVCQMGLAINEQSTDKAGNRRDDTTFVDVDVFGKTADNVAKFLTKGRECMVEGRLKLDSWEDKASGQKRSKLKVVGNLVQFIGGSRDESRTDAPSAPAGNSRGTPSPARDVDEEDVPF